MVVSCSLVNAVEEYAKAKLGLDLGRGNGLSRTSGTRGGETQWSQTVFLVPARLRCGNLEMAGTMLRVSSCYISPSSSPLILRRLSVSFSNNGLV